MYALPLLVAVHVVALAAEPPAEELLDVGPYDRYRVDIPNYAGAEATSPYGSVLLAPPPAGTPYTVEEAPVPDAYVPQEGFDALAIDPWHEEGLDGTGVKIAVFDVQWFNAALSADELGDYQTNDCQAHVGCGVPMDTLRPRYTFEEGSHGVACAEVVHDIAPGAELHLVRVNGGTTLEVAGEWAAANGIDVASMSMSFFSNSFYDGSGLVSGAAARMAQNGTLLVGSAGNYAEEHWDGPFVDADHDKVMDFPWGSEYLPVYLNAPATTILVNWDQYGACGDSDFDVYVYAHDGTLVGKSESRQTPGQDGCSPVERVRAGVETSDWYYLQAVLVGGREDAHLSFYARDGASYQPTPGSMVDPASSPATFTVGAVRAVGYTQNAAEGFSSLGPTLGGADKPDIAGPDGLTTSIYGPIGFYGTSASTPATAATLALIMQRDGVDAFTAAETLKAGALSSTPTWQAWDGALGAGKARLSDPADTFGCGSGGAAGAWAFAPGLLWCARARRRRVRFGRS